MAVRNDWITNSKNEATNANPHAVFPFQSESHEVQMTGVKGFLSRNFGKRMGGKTGPSPKDVVIMHQFPRSYVAPTLSPFCLKLETFLRITKIKYENDFTKPYGSNHKSPWISYNEESSLDSSLSMEFLSKKFDIDLNASLSPQEKATALALKILAEDHLTVCIVLHRFVHDETKTVGTLQKFDYPVPTKVVLHFAKKMVLKNTQGQGLGRFSKEDVLQFAKKDMQALQDFLGDKKYFFGNEPTELDCTMFGVLGQAMWGVPGSPYDKWINGEFSKLRDYCLRIKASYWPDWDDCIMKRPTK